MVSFTSLVWTDMRRTLASGLTKWRPDGSASARTLPKRSTTPTCPAGTTRGERSSRKKRTTMITRKKAARGFTEANVNNLRLQCRKLSSKSDALTAESLNRSQVASDSRSRPVGRSCWRTRIEAWTLQPTLLFSTWRSRAICK
jgi:hypothetical protein